MCRWSPAPAEIRSQGNVAILIGLRPQPEQRKVQVPLWQEPLATVARNHEVIQWPAVESVNAKLGRRRSMRL